MEDFLLEHLRDCHKIARDNIFDLYAGEKELVGCQNLGEYNPSSSKRLWRTTGSRIFTTLYLRNFPAKQLTEERAA